VPNIDPPPLGTLVIGRAEDGTKGSRDEGAEGPRGANWALADAAVIRFSKSGGSGVAGPVE